MMPLDAQDVVYSRQGLLRSVKPPLETLSLAYF